MPVETSSGSSSPGSSSAGSKSNVPPLTVADVRKTYQQRGRHQAPVVAVDDV